jgi:DNA replication initiation complex subunit (GINS family)
MIENKAQNLEEVEDWIFRIFAKYEGIPLKEGEELVKYPRDFKVVEAIERLEKDMEAITSRISRKFTEYATIQYVNHTYPELAEDDPKTYKEIINEIKAKKEPFPLPDSEDGNKKTELDSGNNTIGE